MELKLVDGDYVPDGMGGLQTCSGVQEVQARALFLLTARRGKFPLLPRLGSRLWTLGREKPSARAALAAQYVAEALEQEPDLRVREVLVRQEGEKILVDVYLDWQGEALGLTVDV